MYKIEVTDTFGGEANYGWVRRYTTKARTAQGVARFVRRAEGWHGVRLDVSDYGDDVTVQPREAEGVCMIAFATWCEA